MLQNNYTSTTFLPLTEIFHDSTINANVAMRYCHRHCRYPHTRITWKNCINLKVITHLCVSRGCLCGIETSHNLQVVKGDRRTYFAILELFYSQWWLSWSVATPHTLTYTSIRLHQNIIVKTLSSNLKIYTFSDLCHILHFWSLSIYPVFCTNAITLKQATLSIWAPETYVG